MNTTVFLLVLLKEVKYCGSFSGVNAAGKDRSTLTKNVISAES